MKKIVVLSAVLFSGLAVAQGLPRFGTARFGEAALVWLSLPYPFPSCPCGQPSPSQSHCGLWPI